MISYNRQAYPILLRPAKTKYSTQFHSSLSIFTVFLAASVYLQCCLSIFTASVYLLPQYTAVYFLPQYIFTASVYLQCFCTK